MLVSSIPYHAYLNPFGCMGRYHRNNMKLFMYHKLNSFSQSMCASVFLAWAETLRLNLHIVRSCTEDYNPVVTMISK